MKLQSNRNEVPNWAVVAFALIGFGLGLLAAYFMWVAPSNVTAFFHRPTPTPTATPAPDACNDEFTYEKSRDFEDNRVSIDFFNTQASGNPDSITALAKSGYSVVDIWLELDNNNQQGWDEHYTAELNQFNPPGTDVEEIKMVVRKDCPTPTPTSSPTATPSATPAPATSGGSTSMPGAPAGRCAGKSDPVITQAVATRSGTDASIAYVPTAGEGEPVNVVFDENPFEIILGLGSHGLRDWLPNNGNVQLHELVEGQSYWYRIANGCSPWSGIFFIQ